MEGMTADAAMTPLCERFDRIEQVLSQWERRIQNLEDRVETLPERICQILNERERTIGIPPTTLQHALKSAMEAFTQGLSDTMGLPTMREQVHVPTTRPPSPPLFHQNSSTNKASISNLVSNSQTTIIQAPQSGNLQLSRSSIPSTQNISTISDHNEIQVVKIEPQDTQQDAHLAPPMQLPIESTPLSDTRPRNESSIHFALNASTDDDEDEVIISNSFLHPPTAPPTVVAPINSPPRPPPSHGRRRSSLPPAALPEFLWTDGSKRHAPETWEFPSTTCKAMWMYWFLGDPVHGIGPFRHLTSWDIERYAKDKTSRKQLSRARTVMNKLIEIGIENNWIGDDMDSKAPQYLEEIFDQTYNVLMHQNSSGNLAGDGKLRAERAHSYTYSSVHTFMIPTTRKRKHVPDEKIQVE